MIHKFTLHSDSKAMRNGEKIQNKVRLANCKMSATKGLMTI